MAELAVSGPLGEGNLADKLRPDPVHAPLGRVREAPGQSGFRPGDLLAGLVRHPDPEPCRQCAAGEYDLCTNGRYTERGVVGRDGYDLTIECSRTAALMLEALCRTAATGTACLIGIPAAGPHPVGRGLQVPNRARQDGH